MTGEVQQAEESAVGLDLVVTVVLVMLAAWLRLPPLDPSSLWLDDAWVALVHRTDTLEELRFVGFAAPGFVAGLKLWFEVAGFSELAAQLPAFVAGVVTPVGAYLVARWRSWHRGGALLAGVVLAIAPIAVVYAGRVKQYTTEGLLGIVLLGVALWLVDQPQEDRRWLSLVLVGSACTVVSAFLAPTVAAGLLAALVASMRWRDDQAPEGGRAGSGARAAVRPVLWAAAYGALALVWYRVVLAPAVTTSISGFWSEEFLTTGEGVRALLQSLREAGAAVLAGLMPVPVWLGASALAVAAGLVAVAGVRRPRTEQDLEVLALLLTPSLIAVVLAWLQLAPLGGGRTDLYLYPSLALLLAAGVDAGHRLLAGALRPVAVGGSIVVLAGAVALAFAAEPAGPYPRYDVRPLAADLEEVAGPTEAILVYPATVWAYALYTEGEVHLEADPVSAWGFSPRFADPRVVVLPPGRDNPAAYQPTVDALGTGPAEVVWLLASHWRSDIEDLRAQLEAVGFAGTEVAALDGARLERWER